MSMGYVQRCLLLLIVGSCFQSAYGEIWYVDRDAAAGGDGTSWARAFKTIQPGIDAAFADGGGEVWVAEATYDEQRDATSGALYLRECVELYGGFSGGETSRDERDWTAHSTIIDGSNGLGTDQPAPVGILGASQTRLDGFTLWCEAMYGEYPNAYPASGTVHDVIIANCTFADDLSGEATGLVMNSGVGGRIVSCAFQTDRRTSTYALRIFADEALVQGCLFAPTYSTFGFLGVTAGGYVEFEGCSFLHTTNPLTLDDQAPVLVDRCLFLDNSGGNAAQITRDISGSVSGQDVLGPTFTNCVISGNAVGSLSGVFGLVHWSYDPAYCDLIAPMPCGISCDAVRGTLPLEKDATGHVCETFKVYNCTIVNNFGYGGGAVTILFDTMASNLPFFLLDIRNSVIWGNSEPAVCGLDVQPVSSLVQSDTEGAIDDPGFVDAANRDFRLRSDSPCIDAGSDPRSLGISTLNWDLDGLWRPRDGDGFGSGSAGDGSHYDIGAYEFDAYGSADTNKDSTVSLSELLRVIQLFNSDGLHCDTSTEDGYAPGAGPTNCCSHSSDYNPQDWRIEVSELLRVIQFFNSAGYQYCPGDGTEDGFCPVKSAR